ncbi:MAG: MobF family relaxase [Actinomycetota bacterium]|nr:MobF family relaxase [Actinomycetota bacterium]
MSLAKAAKDYYLQKLGEVSPREDYYLRGGQATGVWRGSGATDQNLDGTVTSEGLVRLFDGLHPATGMQLGRRLRRDGVAAWDVTFSADKSVSLLWALGDEETRQQVLAAFEEATASAFGYLESVASATRGAAKTPVLGDDGEPVLNDNGRPRVRVETWPIETSGFVAASFTEFTSRADDPQLHTHVVVANKVEGKDGIWRSVDGRLLFRHQLAAGYLHEAVLRHGLTRRLGVEWQPVTNGVADIAGFTRRQIDAFSKRRRQAEQWRAEHGLPDTPAARQAAVLATRDPKTDLRLEDLEAEWWRRAKQVGLTAERVASVMGRHWDVTPADPETLFEALASPSGLTAQASTFAEAEVVKEIAGALPDGATRGEIGALATAFLATRDVVPILPRHDQVAEADTGKDVALVDAEGPGESEGLGETTVGCGPARLMRRRDGTMFPGTPDRLYTTAELLATEQRVIEHATDGVAAGRWVVPRRLVETTLRRHPQLTDGQRDMVHSFATSGNVVDVGIGPAGSGKTAVMEVISQLAMSTGTPIVGVALAARTASGLEEATGIPSTTITRLLNQPGDDPGLPTGVVVVVDEAGMVGTRHLAAVSDLVEEAEGKLILVGDDHQLPEIDAGGLFRTLTNRLPASELTDNVRQEHAWERVALTELRNGSPDKAIDAYRQHKRLVVGQDRRETITRAVDDWYRHISAGGDPTAGLLIAADNLTVADLNEEARSRLAASGRLAGPTIETGEREFQAGDRVLCRRNQDRLDVHNGDLGTITSVNPDTGDLKVCLDRDPETRVLPSWYLDDGHVDYGYALTGHKAQGVTTSRTFTVITAGTDREWAYVALSRGREANTLYLANPEPDSQECTHLTHPDGRDPLDALTTSLNRSATQTAAMDHIAGPPPPSSDIVGRVAWIAARRQAERDGRGRTPTGLGSVFGR